MTLNNFSKLKVGTKFLAHGMEATVLLSETSSSSFKMKINDEMVDITAKTFVVQYQFTESREIRCVVSQHPLPDKLELTEYSSLE